MYLPRMILAATLLLSAFISPIQGPEDQVVVTEAVAPNYPPMALLAGLNGIVLVDVEVNQLGTVESLKTASGERLLWQAAEEAAKAWRFAAGRARKIRLEFLFKVMPRGASNADLTTRFRPPSTIEVRGIIPKLESYTMRDVGEGNR